MRFIGHAQRRRDDHDPPMRFVIDDRGEVFFPDGFYGWSVSSRRRTEDGALRPGLPPPTHFVGVDPASIADMIEDGGDLADLVTASGEFAHQRHEHVATFAYDLSPVPALTLGLGDTGGLTLRFSDAVILDWTTGADYSPTHANQELCDLNWDGGQHFLLCFLSFSIILRARELAIEGRR